jgi:hypothetical protein
MSGGKPVASSVIMAFNRRPIFAIFQPDRRMNNAGICALGLPGTGSSCFFTGTAGALMLGT